MRDHQTTSNQLPTHTLTTSEVMAILRVSRNTLCGWARAGKIPAVQLPGGRYLFAADKLAAWMSARSV